MNDQHSDEASEPKALPPAPERKALPPAAEKPAASSHRRLWLLVGGGAILLALLFLLGYLPWRHRQSVVEAAARREARALPIVSVTQVKQSPGVATLLLPGNVTPLEEAFVYARASGYVRRRYVDIGDRVQKGQLLAEIEAPDLDAQVAQARAGVAQAEQQLMQAHAALENAQSQEDLARVTNQRYTVLVSHVAVSRQDADQQAATYRSASANVRLQQAAIHTAEENVKANRANLDRLISLQDFEKVRAPFSGIITARNFDVGALISTAGSSLGVSNTPMGGTQVSGAQGNAGASGTSTSSPSPGAATGGEMYRIAQIRTVRILVNVPQINAPSIHIGQPAKIFVQEFAGHTFTGHVARTTSSLDPTARTLLAEVDAPNPESQLLPGMYAQVQFSESRSSPPLIIPGDAVITTNQGPVVAILVDPTPEQRERMQRQQEQLRAHASASQQHVSEDANQAKRVHLQKVTLGRDYGPEIEIAGGLQGWEHVVANPAD